MLKDHQTHKQFVSQCVVAKGSAAVFDKERNESVMTVCREAGKGPNMQTPGSRT